MFGPMLAVYHAHGHGVYAGDIPHVCVYLDDILITGVDQAEHTVGT